MKALKGVTGWAGVVKEAARLSLSYLSIEKIERDNCICMIGFFQEDKGNPKQVTVNLQSAEKCRAKTRLLLDKFSMGQRKQHTIQN